MKIRVLSYNIHKAIGVDRRFAPERIIEVLRHHEADIVMLQEVDRHAGRSKHLDLASVIASLVTDGFSRLRIGVGRGDPQRDLADHVLSRFSPEELPVVDASLDRAVEAVGVWIDEGIARVMNGFNRADDGAPGL